MPRKKTYNSVDSIFSALNDDPAALKISNLVDAFEFVMTNCKKKQLGAVDLDTGEPSPCWIPNENVRGLCRQKNGCYKLVKDRLMIDTNVLISMVSRYNLNPSDWQWTNKGKQRMVWNHQCHMGDKGCNNPSHGYFSTEKANAARSHRNCFKHSQCMVCNSVHDYCECEPPCCNVLCVLCRECKDAASTTSK